MCHFWPRRVYVPGESSKGTSSTDDRIPARTPSRRAVSDPDGGRGRSKGRPEAAAGAVGHEGGAGMGVIHFYGVSDAYGCLSNFSPHPVKLKGKTWPTSEHYFQAQKFAGTPDEEEVRR